MLLLYEAETRSRPAPEVLADQVVAPNELTSMLVTGVSDHLERVDGLIAGHAHGWTLTRMPVIDRCVLRLAVFELLGRPDVPVAVVIDEAVELAKRFSTDDSGRFVNGVLSAVAREVRG